jgi:hypothetical protein
MPLGGFLTSAPEASIRGASLDVWVRGTDNGLWHKWSNDGGTTWSGWESLGGILTSSQGAVSSSPSRVDVVARGTDNAIWIRSWNSVTGWNNWSSLGGIGISGPSVASCTSGHIDVFVIGTDGGVWQLGFNGTSWSSWVPRGGNWTSDPGAVCRAGSAGIIDIFNRGQDAALWTMSEPAS